MAEMTTQKKVQTCLEFIDNRLETTSEQTIQIAEMIIADIKNLTQAYPLALQRGELKEHSERVRATQLNWVNQLHDIILEQTNRDLNGQVILALQGFVNNLNQNTLKHNKFDLPSVVASQQKDETEYLNQDEIDLLMGQQALFNETVCH